MPCSLANDPKRALNDEAIRNLGYAQMKKTHDVALVLIERADAKRPRNGSIRRIRISDHVGRQYERGVLTVYFVVLDELDLCGGRWMRDGRLGTTPNWPLQAAPQFTRRARSKIDTPKDTFATSR